MTSLSRHSTHHHRCPSTKPLPFYLHLRWPILLKSDSERKCDLSASMIYIICVSVFFLSPYSLCYRICLLVFGYECIFFTMLSHYWIYDLFISLIIIFFFCAISVIFHYCARFKKAFSLSFPVGFDSVCAGILCQKTKSAVYLPN